ncbi:hypothetical protein [Pedobacter sp. UYP1]|uniref:hypothetical protein n=1 Tax=Pedobacter sp. UYP1 TaxID=1756396 RepID=UPI0033962F1A
MLERFAAINSQYGNLKLAVNYQKQVLDIFKNLHNRAKVIKANSNFGFLVSRQGNLENVTNLIEGALTQYKSDKNTVGMLKAYTKLGELNELKGHSGKALLFFATLRKYGGSGGFIITRWEYKAMFEENGAPARIYCMVMILQN